MLVRITASLYLCVEDVMAVSLSRGYDSWTVVITLMGSHALFHEVPTHEEAQTILEDIVEKVQATQSSEYDGLL